MDARIRDAIQAIEEATARVEAQQKAMGDGSLSRAIGFLHSAATAAAQPLKAKGKA